MDEGASAVPPSALSLHVLEGKYLQNSSYVGFPQNEEPNNIRDVMFQCGDDNRSNDGGSLAIIIIPALPQIIIIT